MTDCSLENPCSQGVCNLDEGICEPETNALTIYINGHPFTGSMEAIEAYMISYFSDIEKIRCGSGADIVGALPGEQAFADFEDVNLNRLRDTLEGEEIIGFYDLKTNKIFCEVASTLFNFWKEKFRYGAKYGYVEGGEGVYVSIAPTLLHTYIRKEDAENIINGNNYFYLIIPSNKKVRISNRDNPLYIVIPVGDSNRKELVEREEEVIQPQVIEESEEIREIKEIVMSILENEGATSPENAMTLQNFTEAVRTHLPEVHPERIEAIYTSLIHQRLIQQIRRDDEIKVFMRGEKEMEEIIESNLIAMTEIKQTVDVNVSIPQAQQLRQNLKAEQPMILRLLNEYVNNETRKAEELKNSNLFTLYFDKLDNLERIIENFKRMVADERRKVYNNGNYYQGGSRDGKRHGKGIYAWNNGDIYYGDWVRGAMEGFGIFSWHNGDVYIGEWSGGSMNGKGIKQLGETGDYFYGDWKDDGGNGFGVKMFKNGDRHIGEYENDKRNGLGLYIWDNGDAYYGDWKDGSMDRLGIKKMEDGSLVVGDWENDMIHGFAIKYFDGGDIVIGKYINDYRQGYNIYYFENGDIYMGNWERGEQNDDEGVYYYANRDNYVVTEWREGRRIGGQEI